MPIAHVSFSALTDTPRLPFFATGRSIAVIACFALSGCMSGSTDSDGSDTDDGLPVESVASLGEYTKREVGGGGAITGFEAASVTVRTSDGTTYTLEEAETTLVPGWLTFGADDSDIIAFARASSSGSTAVLQVIGPDNGGINTTAYLREGDTTLPTSGSITYAGEYFGLVSAVGTATIMDGIGGTVSIEANFANSSISGTITNRSSSMVGSPLPDATFDLGRINTVGGISGIIAPTTANVDDDEFYVDGIFRGTLGGAQGHEAAGSVYIEYQNTANDDRFIEYGTFIAEIDD